MVTMDSEHMVLLMIKAEMKVLHEKVDKLTDIVMKKYLDVENLQDLNVISQSKVNESLKSNDFLKQGKKRGKVMLPSNCQECGQIFESKYDLMCHRKTNHKSVIKCKVCDMTFSLTNELEEHMAHHENLEKYSCEECGKFFVLKWRLNKHMELHGNEKRKNCHYYNNNKDCPYDKIGCKFRHIKSKVCRFGLLCTVHLCPLQHQNTLDVSNEADIEKTDTPEIDSNPEEAMEESSEQIFSQCADLDVKRLGCLKSFDTKSGTNCDKCSNMICPHCSERALNYQKKKDIYTGRKLCTICICIVQRKETNLGS